MKNMISRIGNRMLRPYGWLKSQVLRMRKEKKGAHYPIDFVVTWVDGNDESWRQKKTYYAGQEAYIDGGNSDARYRDWGLMRYWLRAVEEYAPWVNKIYFVTCGHKPEYLNLNNEKLVFITHEQFIPHEYLPTFNCCTIELNIWRIPGLSEHFVYFNDDMFLNRQVLPKDFFADGLPKLCALAVPFRFHGDREKQCWLRTLLNDITLINNDFEIRKTLRKYPEKFYSYVYRRCTKYNRRIFEDNYLAGMNHTHSAQTYLKSIFVEIWDKEYHVLDRTCQSKFRNEAQVTSFLPTLWMIFSGLFEPVDISYFGKVINLSSNTLHLALDALQTESRIICLNDNEEMDLESPETFLMMQNCIRDAMEKKFPSVSSFELD